MSLVDLLFPRVCLGCGYLGALLCLNCQKKLKYVEKPTCLYCQKSSYFGLTHPACQKRFGIDGLEAVFYYNDILKKIIKNIKYRLVTQALEELFLVIEPERLKNFFFYQELGDHYFIQPVPLHPRRKTTRGFNQAEIIAAFFNKFLRATAGDFLIRIKETMPQAAITENKKRYLNIRGAFKATGEKIKGKNIILIDDVVTTGGTVKEAARILKLAGAKRVFVLALAKG